MFGKHHQDNLKGIPITIRQSKRAKHIRLTISGDGVVVVTQPIGVSRERSEKILSDRKDWIVRKLQFLKNVAVQHRSSHTEYTDSRKEVLNRVQARVIYFNVLYGHTYKRISIRNQQSRWGSCSRRGNLNFNYRIMHLPPDLMDYIVVHELCHLAELNHSANFWKLVEKAIPRYQERRKELKLHRLLAETV